MPERFPPPRGGGKPRPNKASLSSIFCKCTRNLCSGTPLSACEWRRPYLHSAQALTLGGLLPPAILHLFWDKAWNLYGRHVFLRRRVQSPSPLDGRDRFGITPA